MKTLLLTISLIFSLMASAQIPQFAPKCADDNEGVNAKEIKTGPPPNGTSWNYSNNKDKAYYNGVLYTGIVKVCGKNTGKVMSKLSFKNGIKDGLSYKYHKDGWLLWKKRYSFGKEDGVQKYFHPSLNMANDGKNVTNTLRTRLSYEAENGKKEGIVRAWYSNGNKEYVERYTNGVKHGEQLYYYESEKLMLKETWIHGNVNGFQTYYDPNGNLVMKVGNLLLVGHEDLGEMNWVDAVAACEALGDGWHLPTKDELDLLYQNKDVIDLWYRAAIGGSNAAGGFILGKYWSSTASDNGTAFAQDFYQGYLFKINQIATYPVRAVRAINP